MQTAALFRLVHDTTREYLQTHMLCIKSQKDATSLEDHMINSDPNNHDAMAGAHRSIAAVCRTYLLYAVFETGICQTDDEFREQMQSNHLYGYAACNWGHHARKASTLSPDVIGFLERKLNVDAVIQVLLVFAQPLTLDWRSQDFHGEAAAQDGG